MPSNSKEYQRKYQKVYDYNRRHNDKEYAKKRRQASLQYYYIQQLFKEMLFYRLTNEEFLEILCV